MLLNRLQSERDRHRHELADVQASLDERLGEKQSELELLLVKLDEMQQEQQQTGGNSSSKKQSHDGWSISDDDIQISTSEEENNKKVDTDERSEQQQQQLELVRAERDELAAKCGEHEKRVDELELELRQAEQAMHQEKLIQMQEQKLERQEMARLKLDNQELKIKLDEKTSEIKLLGEQINELNDNVNSLKRADAGLFAELQAKTERFVSELDAANREIVVLRERAADANANSMSEEKRGEGETGEEGGSVPDELAALKQQYNQVYGYLEQKNAESLGYYDEIQRLNGCLGDMQRELAAAKTLNESLHEQYENLAKECQLEQKMVEDLRDDLFELNRTLASTDASGAPPPPQQQQQQQQQQAASPSPVKVQDGDAQTDELFQTHVSCTSFFNFN